MPPLRPRTVALVALGAAALAGALALVLLARPPGEPRPSPPAEDAAPAGRGEGLAPKPADAPAAPLPSDPTRATVAGVVLRGGRAVAARVAAYLVQQGRDGEVFGWTEDSDPPWSVPAQDPAQAPADARAEAGPDGAFALEVAAPSQVRLVATDAEGREGVAWAWCRRAGARYGASVEIAEGGATLAGRVLHADGRPFRGRVAVHAHGTRVLAGSAAGGAATDEQGRFRVGGLVPGPNLVTAYEPGRFASTSPVVAVPRPGEFVFVLDADLHEWKGRVTDAETHAGIGGARVVAHGNKGGGRSDYTTETRTAADGTFAVRFARGYAEWAVEAPGYPRNSLWLTSLDPAKPVVLEVSRGHRVAGRVVRDDDGTPVAGIAVFAQYASTDPTASATTGADGRFALEGLGARWVSVAAHGAGWTTKGLLASTKASDPLAVRPGEGSGEVEIRVVRAGAIRGRVLDAGGAPVAGAEVSTWPKSLSLDAPWAYSLARYASAFTAADGTFRIGTVVPGLDHTVTASGPDGAAGEAEVRVEGGAEAVVEVRLTRGKFVEVRCATKAGDPVAGATVKVRPQGGQEASGTTDRAGRAWVGPLARGGLLIEVEPPEGYALESEEEATADEDARDPAASFVLRPVRRVAGRAWWSDGTPAKHAFVRATVPGDEDSTEYARVDVAGAFEFEDAPGETVELGVLADGNGEPVATATAHAGDENVEFRLAVPPPPRTTIRVRRPDGQPVSGGEASVVSLREDGPRHDDPYLEVLDGECTTRLVEGETWVRARSRVPADGATFGTGTVGPIAAGAREIVVTLPFAKAIAGTVKDAEGRPVPGILLTAIPMDLPDGFLGYSERQTVRTDAQGRFRVGFLGPEDQEVRVEVPEGFEPIGPYRVAAGREDLVLVLGPRRETVLRVVDAGGLPVEGARVTAELSDRRPVALADADGRVRLLGLDADGEATVVVRVQPPESRPDLQRAAGPLESFAGGEIRLAKAFPVRGLVRDEAGMPLRAEVKARGDEAGAGPIHTADDGSFVVPHLAEGRVRLRASTFGPSRLSPVVEVAAGESGVVLVAERTREVTVVLDGVAGRGLAGWIQVVERGGDLQGSWDVDAGGAAVAEDLRPSAVYVVTGHAEGEDGTDLVGRVEVARNAGERVVVPMQPAFAITGRVALPDGAVDRHIEATDGVETIHGDLAGNGTLRIGGLLPGRWRVTAQAHAGDERWTAAAEVEAGQAVTLTLRPTR